MITKSVDWNSDGLEAGSNMEELDWKDWKRPVISLLSAKLFLKSTYSRSTLSTITSQNIPHLQDWI
jgi:hypothetical protein